VGPTRLFEVFGLASSADPWRSQSALAGAADLVLRGPVQGLLDPAGVAPGLPLLAIGVWLPGGLALLAAIPPRLCRLDQLPVNLRVEALERLEVWGDRRKPTQPPSS
jgi:hypothetical protein